MNEFPRIQLIHSTENQYFIYGEPNMDESIELGDCFIDHVNGESYCIFFDDVKITQRELNQISAEIDAIIKSEMDN